MLGWLWPSPIFNIWLNMWKLFSNVSKWHRQNLPNQAASIWKTFFIILLNYNYGKCFLPHSRILQWTIVAFPCRKPPWLIVMIGGYFLHHSFLGHAFNPIWKKCPAYASDTRWNASTGERWLMSVERVFGEFEPWCGYETLLLYHWIKNPLTIWK